LIIFLGYSTLESLFAQVAAQEFNMSDSDQVNGTMEAMMLTGITGGIAIAFFLFLGGVL